jgi:hypothetical protein
MAENIFSTPGTYEIIQREGTANPIEEPNGICIEGTLTAPSKFFHGKLSCDYPFDNSKIHVIVNREAGVIKFVANEDSKLTRISVTGVLKKTAIVQEFEINTGHSWGMRDLISFIKKTKFYFPDKDEHKAYIESISKVNAEVVKSIQQEDDLKGHKLFKFVSDVNTKFNGDFKVKFPIFKDSEEVTFRVETNLDVTDGGIRFQLQSDELYELAEKIRKDMIDTEVQLLDELTIVEV